MTSESNDVAREILARGSKSFAFAGRLLPSTCRAAATALYAWCRRCDDAVDGPLYSGDRAAQVLRLRVELERVYGPGVERDPVLAGFQSVVRKHALPRRYTDDFVAGMAMDVDRVRYRTFDDLLLYCYRAAGTVGLMMAHVMGVRDPTALRRAADLGIAMQLTNICRDVVEDEARDRVYLPQQLLDAPRTDGHAGGDVRGAVAHLLGRAEEFYASADAGMTALPTRSAVAIRAARLIYADIGRVIARRNFDVAAGRAVVSPGRKLWLALRAALGTLSMLVIAKVWGHGRRGARLPRPLPFTLPIASPGAS